MSKRPTMHDLARIAGVSVTTVDRVLNGRHAVRRETAQRVLDAAEEIGFHAVNLIKQRVNPEAPKRTFGFVLQKEPNTFFQSLREALETAVASTPGVQGRMVASFASEISAPAVIERLEEVSQQADVIGVVSVDHPSVSQMIDDIRRRGIPTFALITRLTAPTRAGYIGADDRKAGRMAAWTIARMSHHPGEVGIIVSSHRYLRDELREIGFLSYFREQAPSFRVLETLVSLGESRLSYEATLNMLKKHPDLVGLYVAGGGIEGVIRALREERPPGSIFVVVNELTNVTRSALIDNHVTLTITTPVQLLARRAIDAMLKAIETPQAEGKIEILVPFEINTVETIL